MFSPVNRIVLLARTISVLTHGTTESVDTYGFCVTQAVQRLLAEAKRTAPTNVSPYKHAWQISLVVTFESGLISQIRVELIREDPSLSYQAPRTHAQKYEINALSGPSPLAPPPTYVSALTGSPPGMAPAHDRRLITPMANTEKTIVSQLTAERDRGKRVTFDPSSYGLSDKRGRSAAPRKTKTSKTPCDSVAGRHRDTHTRAECRLAKSHEGLGLFPKKG